MSFNLNEEIIDGHLVTAETKKLWAVEMDLAQKLLEVCKKHNLKIWADGGTLLGAVRHKGFIPWDDDIDFVMMRDDYNRLLEIGPMEFKDPYFFQSFNNDTHSWSGLVKIRRSDTAMIEMGYQYHKDFNRGIFIDVIAMDAIPKDISEYRSIYKRIERLGRLLQNYRMVDSKLYPLQIKISHFIINIFVKMVGPRLLRKKIDELLSKYRISDNEYCALVEIYSLERIELDKIKRRDKHCYDETIMLPFHDMKLPAPVGYHKLLTTLFGDYMVPVQGAAMHSIIIVDCDRSYKTVMKELRRSENHK